MTTPEPGTGDTVALSQQHIVIHESAHGEPTIACRDFAQGRQRAFHLLTRDQALHNADSYTALARNLVIPGAAAMSPIHPDVGDQAVPAVEDPLALLDRWVEGADFDTSQLYAALVATRGQVLRSRAPVFAEALDLVHSEFPDVGAPAVPGKDVREKVAAINDRYGTAHGVTSTNTAGLTVVAGTALAFDVGARRLTVPPGFGALDLRRRIELLALALFRALPEVSPGREGPYARLAPKLTNRRTPGFALSSP